MRGFEGSFKPLWQKVLRFNPLRPSPPSMPIPLPPPPPICFGLSSRGYGMDLRTEVSIFSGVSSEFYGGQCHYLAKASQDNLLSVEFGAVCCLLRLGRVNLVKVS